MVKSMKTAMRGSTVTLNWPNPNPSFQIGIHEAILLIVDAGVGRNVLATVHLSTWFRLCLEKLDLDDCT
jgi:hypothetical protein